MIDLIVNQLKTGAWKQVVPYGYKTPAGRYIVVKEESTELGYTRWRITGHIPGAADGVQPDIIGLRLYMRKTIYDLLDRKLITDSTRALYLERIGEKTGSLYTGNSDGTISLETTYRQVACP